jgi:hypothetical protein
LLQLVFSDGVTKLRIQVGKSVASMVVEAIDEAIQGQGHKGKSEIPKPYSPY